MKKLLILSFSLFLLSCGGESKKEDKTKTDSVVKNTTAPKEEKVEPKTEEKPAAALETPLKATIKEIKRSEKSLSILLTLESVADEKITPNLFFTNLEDEEGLECDVELMDGPKPLFNFKDMYKGDKASGWLTFKYPTTEYKPKALIFSAIMGDQKLCVIDIPEK
jgi:hypothetical protein